jgi:hypothetical protein
MKPNSLFENFIFPFGDPRWPSKLVVGGLLILASLLIPLVPLFFVAGYCLRICQRIIHDGGEAYLPEWDDWNGYFRNGFKFSEAGLVYALPGLILLTASYLMVFYPLIAASMIRIITGTPQVLSPAATEWIKHGAVLMGVAILLTLVGGFFSAPAAMHMVEQRNVKAVFRIKEWWKILILAPGKFAGAFALVAIGTILLMFTFTVMTATLVLCLPAAILFSGGSFYLALAASALFARAYRAGRLVSNQSNSGGNHV